MEQSFLSLYILILFILIVLLLNIWVQRGPITVISRLAGSIGVGIIITIVFHLTSYFISGTYHSLIMIALITQLLIAMVIGLVVWLGYSIFGSSQEKED